MRRIRRFGVVLPYSSNRVRIFDCVNVLGGVAIYSTDSSFYNDFGVSDSVVITQS